jgi:hypothetical protein
MALKMAWRFLVRKLPTEGIKVMILSKVISVQGLVGYLQTAFKGLSKAFQMSFKGLLKAFQRPFKGLPEAF